MGAYVRQVYRLEYELGSFSMTMNILPTQFGSVPVHGGCLGVMINRGPHTLKGVPVRMINYTVTYENDVGFK